MVQSSRLKKRSDPVLTIVLIILLLGGFLYLVYPTFKARIGNSFANYENQRAVLISQYNDNFERLDGLLTSEHGTLIQYREKLIESQDVLERQSLVLNEISSLNLNSLQKTSNPTQYSTIQTNMVEDSVRLSRSKYLEDIVSSKISAINMYNTIKSYDKCIRKIKDKHDLLNCRDTYNTIGEPATRTSLYEDTNTTFFKEYFVFSRSQRAGVINVLVKEHNRMIKKLETIINQAISLQ